MPFPFSIEDRIEVRIDSPEKASRVAEGIEQWLLKHRAREVRWDGACLHFRGPYWNRKLTFHNSLRGIDDSQIQFQNLSDKVVIDYVFRYEPIAFFPRATVPFVMIAIASLLHPTALLFTPVAVAAVILLWSAGRAQFRASFEVAAIRGMADGAAREYEALRSQ